MAKGGKQPGAGRPRGKKNKATLEKEAVLKEFKDKVLTSTDILFNSQLTLARGQTYLYKIEKEVIVGPKGGKTYKNKRPELVTEKWEIEDYLQGLIEEGDKDDENDSRSVYYFLTTKDPDNKAIDSMLDRTFGKATQIIGGDKNNPVSVQVVNYADNNTTV